MNNLTQQGGPAFPVATRAETVRIENGDQRTLQSGFTGMSLRDWFAGRVLEHYAARMVVPEQAAACAYRLADAMLTVRELGEGSQGSAGASPSQREAEAEELAVFGIGGKEDAS